jgi:hypothetical protein
MRLSLDVTAENSNRVVGPEALLDDSKADPAPPENRQLFSSNHKDEYTDQIMGLFGGTILGFGTGHLAQGRFWESGWIYFLSDAILLPVRKKPYPLYGEDDGYIPGLSLFILARAFQAYDVWTWEGNQEPSKNLSWSPVLFPTESGRKIGLSLSSTF